MRFLSLARHALNGALALFNLRLETLTRERAERGRLLALAAAGHFRDPVYPISAALRSARPDHVFALLDQYRGALLKFVSSRGNEAGFSYDNEYFPSPDAEVLYCMIRDRRPPAIVEVGSGNSTRLMRQAMRDEGMPCRLTCIDPDPRIEIEGIADRVERRPVETFATAELEGMLVPGSLLFIDSSHALRTGGDLEFLYLRLLPMLPAGVLVHIHDIFLPYEYPSAWVIVNGWNWNEQALVQALLVYDSRCEVLWAGHYFQRTLEGFAAHFAHAAPGTASSLWLRTVGDASA